MEDTPSKFMSESIKRHEENSNLIKETQASTDTAIRNQRASIKTLEIQIRQMSKLIHTRYAVWDPPNTSASHKSIPKKEEDPRSFTLPCFINNLCFNNALADLGASINVMPLSTYLNLGLGEFAHTKLTVELADRTVKYPKEIAKNMLVGIGKFVFPIDFIIYDMPEDINVPLILGRPFLSTDHAKINVFKRKITLRVREEKIIFKSVKPAKSLIKRVYMISLKERIERDLEARLMGETFMFNRSLDPFFEDYIELNDLNVPLELRRDQVDDLMPTIEEGKVVKEFRARNDARMTLLKAKKLMKLMKYQSSGILCMIVVMLTLELGLEYLFETTVMSIMDLDGVTCLNCFSLTIPFFVMANTNPSSLTPRDETFSLEKRLKVELWLEDSMIINSLVSLNKKFEDEFEEEIKEEEEEEEEEDE
nr:hypothetical protein [Tanacetum cinerariifolium]